MKMNIRNSSFRLFFCIMISLWILQEQTTDAHDQPVIGILVEETWAEIPFGEYLTIGPYQSFVEIAGGRLAPIFMNQPLEYYDYMLGSVNGLILPGGNLNYTEAIYTKATVYLYQSILEMNNRGDYFPVWGVCLGMEVFVYLEDEASSPLVVCDGLNETGPVYPAIGAKHSNMLRGMSNEMFHILTHEDVAEQNHGFCFAAQKLQESEILSSFFRAVAYNQDKGGLLYISMVEAFDYPIYGVQWHPEKSNNVWNTQLKINHSANAIKITQYLANFFVGEARRNQHRFPSQEAESNALINNYLHYYMGPPSFNVLYFHTRKEFMSQQENLDKMKQHKVKIARPSEYHIMPGIFDGDILPHLAGDEIKFTSITTVFILIGCLVIGFLVGRFNKKCKKDEVKTTKLNGYKYTTFNEESESNSS